MTISAFGSALTFDPARGEFVNESHRRLARIINEYEPTLHLMSVVNENAAEGERYALVHIPLGKKPYIVFTVEAAEMNENLLARIWLNDSRKNDPLAYLEKLEAAQKAIKMRAELDAREESKDRAGFMLRSPLHTINMGNGRKVRT